MSAVHVTPPGVTEASGVARRAKQAAAEGQAKGLCQTHHPTPPRQTVPLGKARPCPLE